MLLGWDGGLHPVLLRWDGGARIYSTRNWAIEGLSGALAGEMATPSSSGCPLPFILHCTEPALTSKTVWMETAHIW